ncbi:Ditrans,polycis-undecaprenyl-diphosphate synthase ((2E,6E)-farnesyl-diphosphate specific) [Jeotgalicoccus aerolatus]|uniref:Isoprenyl transferase n=1 Tax=Jeotgalicoccus aerolatus TaxID=709510 RepID=A0A1G8WBS4_9STAP|nr:isoprenyl transferase [Jeotgalicoccus aerolatus]MBP1951482.1 undecaprenyl diphosphate synthase [Jeotgalicoccus aerolatus]GGD97148.1 isoprenyl transferase [Jeotgalicoccus aerolatus]CAD2076420.1 Ditrans,polycis-undecaprenyl-diphosphate synthase ((2E,6E)-farnesyl-diphosphate specific) [Jeotgalicoccus aerolatus]SDJ75651.1 undecaprenyl diphosphate synthase [Jeotgalicoccus aerolatus]
MFKATKDKSLIERPVPEHIAMIMDGNGRYAKLRNLPRIKGHYEGMQNVKRIVRHAADINLKYLTLYAFSTENWARPKSEVNYLLKLPTDFLSTFLPELIEKNVKVKTIGDFEALPKHTRKAVSTAIDKTAENTGLTLVFALNYGGRDELIGAVKDIAADISAGRLQADNIDSKTIDDYLMTKNMPDPEMIIRTSGEYRLSNFLLWQASYSELFFSNTLWPEFSTDELDDLILQYQKRERRFGGLNEEDAIDED